MILAYTEEVMNSYIDLEIILDKSDDSEIKSRFITKNAEINNLKTDYNNVLLRYNNVINMIPNKIILMKVFGLEVNKKRFLKISFYIKVF